MRQEGSRKHGASRLDARGFQDSLAHGKRSGGRRSACPPFSAGRGVQSRRYLVPESTYVRGSPSTVPQGQPEAKTFDFGEAPSPPPVRSTAKPGRQPAPGNGNVK